MAGIERCESDKSKNDAMGDIIWFYGGQAGPTEVQTEEEAKDKTAFDFSAFLHRWCFCSYCNSN